MPYEFITVTPDGAVVRLQLSRPDVHNAFNDVMIAELRQAFETLGQDPSVRVIILAAEGKSFCAGADLTWMRRMMEYSFKENQADARALAEMLKVVCECPKPVIARIHGNVFGGGVGLLAACDFAVATEAAQFALTEVKLGLIPAVISPFLLRKMSVQSAQRYFMTGERFDVRKAQQFGLVDEFLPDEATMDEWLALRVKAILANGPEAVANAKRLIHEVLAPDWPRLLEVTSRMIAERRASAEGQEGMTAFLEKRQPAWMTPE